MKDTHPLPDFYVAGGTLRRDAPSYVQRRADDDLYNGLRAGQFCYVLTSRQMGKSSLMVRTAVRLREAGVAVAVLDLTAIGQNLTAEQWYDGLLARVGQQLGLEDELEDFWLAHPRLGPLQRWMQAVREVVLQRHRGRVVIFVDEIDVVRSLPFATDEFFAGIREFYNRRTEDPELSRLAFCLLGVATPSDLIRDTRTTPFNIGRRVELTDFSEAEAAPLARGLRRSRPQAARLLRRVLHWTGGHPYLTQRLCLAVAEDESARGPRDVDRLCQTLFLAARARERDDNLLFVRERLLRNEAELAGLLDLYRRVHRRERVRDDDTDPLLGLLRLSGVTKVRNGYVRVRNRIYAQVFGRAWVETNMPDAERRRQRAAYRRGLLRAAAAAAVVLIALASLAFAVFTGRQSARIAEEKRRADDSARVAQGERDEAERQRGNAERERAEAEAQRRRAVEAGEDAERQRDAAEQLRLTAEEQRGEAERQRQRAEQLQGLTRRLLYNANLNLAQKAWEENDAGRSLELLEGQRPAPGQEDLRGFEWYYLWRLAHKNNLSLPLGSPATSIAFAPDGSRLAAGGQDGRVRVWDVASGKEALTLQLHTDPVRGLSFSPDGRLAATADSDGRAIVWDVGTEKPIAELRGAKAVTKCLAFSSDGRRLVTAGGAEAQVWDAMSGRLLHALAGHQGEVLCAAFSPDGRRLATGSYDGAARVWPLEQEQTVFRGHTLEVTAAAFSPGGRHLVTVSWDKTARLWDVATGKTLHILKGHTSGLHGVAFSPDGTKVVTAGDKTARIWDVATGRALLSLTGHDIGVGAAVFSPDGRTVLTAGSDGTARLWDAASGRELRALRGHQGAVRAVAFSRDGTRLLTGGDDKTARLWDAAGGAELTIFTGHTLSIWSAAFSPDGRRVASAGWDKTARLWEAATGRALQTLKGHGDRVWSVAFSPDGGRVATAGTDDTARLWDVETGQELVTLRGHDGAVRGLAFSPDGKTIATVSKDRTVRLWHAPDPEPHQ